MGVPPLCGNCGPEYRKGSINHNPSKEDPIKVPESKTKANWKYAKAAKKNQPIYRTIPRRAGPWQKRKQSGSHRRPRRKRICRLHNLGRIRGLRDTSCKPRNSSLKLEVNLKFDSACLTFTLETGNPTSFVEMNIAILKMIMIMIGKENNWAVKI